MSPLQSASRSNRDTTLHCWSPNNCTSMCLGRSTKRSTRVSRPSPKLRAPPDRRFDRGRSQANDRRTDALPGLLAGAGLEQHQQSDLAEHPLYLRRIFAGLDHACTVGTGVPHQDWRGICRRAPRSSPLVGTMKSAPHPASLERTPRFGKKGRIRDGPPRSQAAGQQR